MFELHVYCLDKTTGRHQMIAHTYGTTLSHAVNWYYDWLIETPTHYAQMCLVWKDRQLVSSPSNNVSWSVEEVKSQRKT